MTDQLGQSQVIPYLIGLSKKGHIIAILSFEKKISFNKSETKIRELFDNNKISWHPQFYKKNPPVLSTILDIMRMKKIAFNLNKTARFDIVHCRSYIAAFAGNSLKQKYGTKFLFDIRGFWPEERVDGKIWNLNNPFYKFIFKYFKRKEKIFFQNADGVISLTNASANIIKEKFAANFAFKPIEVIPCCADISHFDFKNCDKNRRNLLKNNLQITDQQLVILYLGSIGTWYMLNEMLDFFSQIQETHNNSIFLFVTKDNPETILLEAEKKNISKESIRIISAEREELPIILSLASLALFFIKPVFSKKASSPTKLAELLGMGIPVISNAGVGDMDYFFGKHEMGFLINNFSPEEYQIAINKIGEIQNIPKESLQNIAKQYFSLEHGVDLYDSMYNKII